MTPPPGAVARRIGAGHRIAAQFATRLFGAKAASWLAPVLAPSLPALAGLLAFSLATAALALAPPYLTKLIIDEGLLAQDRDALILFTGALFAVGLVALLLGALNSILHMRFSARMLVRLRARLLDGVLGHSLRWHARMRTGEVLSRLDGDAGEVQQFAMTALLAGAGASLRLVGGAAMLMVLEWRLALLAIVLIPFELAFLAWARPRTETLARDVRTERGHTASLLAETFAGLPVLQGLGAEPARRGAFAERQERLTGSLLDSQRWQEFVRLVPQTGIAILRAAIFLIGGFWVIAGTWQLGSLIAFTAYLGFLIGPVQTLLNLYHAQARVKVSLERLNAIVSATPEIAPPASPVPLPPGQGAIAFDRVRLRHPDAEQPVLDGFCADLPAASKIRLEGSSGVGKTSLAGLLQRHFDPDAGTVRLDGTDVRDIALAELRGAVALVPQAGFVFAGTIEENLRLAAPDAPEEALWTALETAGLADFVRARPEGLATPLGERALGLSGGERQRLSLARALLLPFRVLVLDESLSDVDPQEAGRIMERIDRAYGDRTRIVVTHGHGDVLGPFDRVVSLAPLETAS